MIVLREILKVWKGDGRRVLLFAQTIQMLDILQLFLDQLSDELSEAENIEEKEAKDKGDKEAHLSEVQRKERNKSRRKASYSYLRLDGRVPITTRHRIIETFQRDPVSQAENDRDISRPSCLRERFSKSARLQDTSQSSSSSSACRR